MANPDHVVAEPFRGPAKFLLNASSEATHLMEYVRGVVATYERNIVSTALQSMRVIEDITVIPEISISTNDMTQFPSQEYPLFPEYLDKRYSQFKYTVNSKGIIVVDTSGATTNRLLESIEDLLYRLER